MANMARTNKAKQPNALETHVFREPDKDVFRACLPERSDNPVFPVDPILIIWSLAVRYCPFWPLLTNSVD